MLGDSNYTIIRQAIMDGSISIKHSFELERPDDTHATSDLADAMAYSLYAQQSVPWVGLDMGMKDDHVYYHYGGPLPSKCYQYYLYTSQPKPSKLFRFLQSIFNYR